MNKTELRQRLIETENELRNGAPWGLFGEFDTPHGTLDVYLTGRLRRKCRKGGVWRTPPMLTALKNVTYGYDSIGSHSRGGLDGIFRLDRSYSPPNSMMKKVFGFLDKFDPLVAEIVESFDSIPNDWIPVRIVSHHMRLLGFILLDKSTLMLIDFDNDKN